MIALEQAAEHIEDKNYEEWSRAAYLALSVSGDDKKTVKDLIGERPYNRRMREKAEQEKPKQDDEALKQLALDTGLKPF